MRKGEGKPAKEPKPAKALKAPKPPKEKKAKASYVYEPKREDPCVRGVLGWLNVLGRTPCVVIAQAKGHTSASPERVWEVFTDLSKWPSWTKPVVSSAKWVHSDEWLSGAQFEETMTLGFPISGKPLKETIKEAIYAQSAAYLHDSKAKVRTVQLWYFQPEVDGSTDIVYTLGLYGQPVFFLKILFFIYGKWNKMMKQVVDNLIRTAERGPS